MKRLLPLAFALLALAACSKPAENRAPMRDPRPQSAAAADAQARAAGMAADTAAMPPTDAAEAADAPNEAPAQTSAPIPAGIPMMAYAYSFALEASPGKVRGLEGRHEAACVAAGPTVCVVTGSSVSEEGKDRVSAQLTLRATPAWLAKFKAGLAKDADDAGGRVTKSEVTSEDLSRQIVDTEATLRAKTTLRDRLQGILATRPGKVSELLEVETSLSEVQGQIDTTTSELAMMRQRVATSEVTLNYESVGVLAPQGVLAPLAHALSDFLGIIVETLAGMVRLVAWLAPWGLVLWLVLWLFRKRLPKVRWPFGKKAPTPPA